MMKLKIVVLLSWMPIMFGQESESDAGRRLTTALSEFEYFGNGACAVTAECSSMSCFNSYYERTTYSQYHSTNTETCAQDALDAGARGFTVNGNSWCYLHPEQDPGLATWSSCPQSGCPSPSPYGDYALYGSDWKWFNNGGTAPILGTSPSSTSSCYRRARAIENPTEAPTENPTEVPTENPTEGCVEPVCCKAQTAECLSCYLGLTVEEFCILSSLTPGCTSVVDPCHEYSHKGSCRKQRNCIWRKLDKKCITG